MGRAAPFGCSGEVLCVCAATVVGEAKLRMQTGRGSAAASVGARLLGEIEETTLDEVRGLDLAIAMCWFPEVGVVEMEMHAAC